MPFQDSAFTLEHVLGFVFGDGASQNLESGGLLAFRHLQLQIELGACQTGRHGHHAFIEQAGVDSVVDQQRFGQFGFKNIFKSNYGLVVIHNNLRRYIKYVGLSIYRIHILAVLASVTKAIIASKITP